MKTEVVEPAIEKRPLFIRQKHLVKNNNVKLASDSGNLLNNTKQTAVSTNLNYTQNNNNRKSLFLFGQNKYDAGA